MNHSYFRKCTEISICAKLKVNGLSDNPRNHDTFYIDTSFGGFYPELKGRSSIVLHIYNTVHPFNNKWYSDRIIEKLENASSLIDFLSLTNEVTLCVTVIATDTFSGISKFFASTDYDINSITSKKFSSTSEKISDKTP